MFTPWENLLRFNLPAMPEVGTVMGFSWLPPDPNGDAGSGGQLQCWGWADGPSNYSTWVFSDMPAGPAGGATAVESDSWGRIKTTFPQTVSAENRKNNSKGHSKDSSLAMTFTRIPAYSTSNIAQLFFSLTSDRRTAGADIRYLL